MNDPAKQPSDPQAPYRADEYHLANAAMSQPRGAGATQASDQDGQAQQALRQWALGLDALRRALGGKL